MSDVEVGNEMEKVAWLGVGYPIVLFPYCWEVAIRRVGKSKREA